MHSRTAAFNLTRAKHASRSIIALTAHLCRTDAHPGAIITWMKRGRFLRCGYEVMKRFVGTVVMLLLGGCGPHTVQTPLECPESADCAACAGGEECDDGPVSFSPTNVNYASPGLPGSEPPVSSSWSPADIDVLLSLFADDLVLDLLTPADLNYDLSYLERLCREGNTPEFICRQRFGH